MTIRIKADGHNVRLWLPTSILKTRFGYSIVNKMIANEHDKRTKKIADEKSNDTATIAVERDESKPQLSREQVKEIYAILKRIIKANGHFNLVEVESAKGERVRIRV